MGLYLGLSVVPALLAAFLTGTIFGLAIIAREGAQARKKAVPFGDLPGASAGSSECSSGRS